METRVSGREAQKCDCGGGREGVDWTRLGARPVCLALSAPAGCSHSCERTPAPLISQSAKSVLPAPFLSPASPGQRVCACLCGYTILTMPFRPRMCACAFHARSLAYLHFVDLHVCRRCLLLFVVCRGGRRVHRPALLGRRWPLRPTRFRLGRLRRPLLSLRPPQVGRELPPPPP